jgi:glycosyltransferase involved in cell wall biosynthesis
MPTSRCPPLRHPEGTPVSGAQPGLAPLDCRYLLVIHIPLTIDAQGRRWTERLWKVDLARHTDYIRDLTVGCPFVRGNPEADSVPADMPGLRFVPIPYPRRTLLSLLRAPLSFWQLWRLVGRYDFVHSIYGTWWPLGTPYLVNLAAHLRGKCLFVNVEASPWRLVRGERSTPLRRLQAALAETLNRWTLSLADLAVFTHDGYRRDLLRRRPERGHVLHASWIDEAIVLDDASARAQWQARHAGEPRALRLLFAGRLEEDKGVRIMLDAMQRLRNEGALRVELSIIGAGELESICREQAVLSDERVQVRLLAPVTYGEPFFALLRQHDALLVPNLADEQPRIVYDAYSQALPVLATATPGLATCVDDGVTGHLFAPDAAALADTVRRAAADPQALERMGLRAVSRARSMTHQEMHRRRHVLIARTLADCAAA